MPLLPWCERLAARLEQPLARGVCGWALGIVHRSAERAGHECGSAPPSSGGAAGEIATEITKDDATLSVAMECLLGHVRLYLEMGRAHRGLVARWALPAPPDSDPSRYAS